MKSHEIQTQFSLPDGGRLLVSMNVETPCSLSSENLTFLSGALAKTTMEAQSILSTFLTEHSLNCTSN